MAARKVVYESSSEKSFPNSSEPPSLHHRPTPSTPLSHRNIFPGPAGVRNPETTRGQAEARRRVSRTFIRVSSGFQAFPSPLSQQEPKIPTTKQQRSQQPRACRRRHSGFSRTRNLRRGEAAQAPSSVRKRYCSLRGGLKEYKECFIRVKWRSSVFRVFSVWRAVSSLLISASSRRFENAESSSLRFIALLINDEQSHCLVAIRPLTWIWGGRQPS